MALGKRKSGGTSPVFETTPPHQRKPLNDGDDNWQIHGSSKPLPSPSWDGNPQDGQALEASHRRDYPVYSTSDSEFIHRGLKPRP